MICNEHTKALLSRAQRYCSQQEQCGNAVRQKLTAWGATGDEIDDILAALYDDRYLDDCRYARAYCESKMLRQHWGRQKVLYQLRLKRLPREAIEAGMEAVDEEAYLQALQEFVERKVDGEAWKTEHGAQKLTASLLSRGYSYADIKQVITNMSEKFQ